MKGEFITATLHGGTVYGFGKEAAEATAEGAHPGRLPEAVSHTFGLEAKARSARPSLAGIAMADPTPTGHAGVDELCLWRFPGGAIRIGPRGDCGFAAQTASAWEDPAGVSDGTSTPVDAGYVGFDLCRQIMASGADFLIRMSSTVTLYTEQEEPLTRYREGIVY